jgi:hypothetical protein
MVFDLTKHFAIAINQAKLNEKSHNKQGKIK